jgi:hypothetical protein
MIAELIAAGFSGVEMVDGVIYARTHAAVPEFIAQDYGDGWQLEIAWPVRATEAQRAGWNAAHPGAVLDIHNGETRMVMRVGDLGRWAELCDLMVVQCTQWRRQTRQRDEGM